MRINMRGGQRNLKPDPVCAVDSTGEHVTVESGHVVGRDMLVCMNNFVNARQLYLTAWCKVDHWGSFVSYVVSLILKQTLKQTKRLGGEL